MVVAMMLMIAMRPVKVERKGEWRASSAFHTFPHKIVIFALLIIKKMNLLVTEMIHKICW